MAHSPGGGPRVSAGTPTTPTGTELKAGVISLPGVLMQSVTSVRFGGAAVLVFCAIVMIGISRLGYVEFGVAYRMLMSGEFWQ